MSLYLTLNYTTLALLHSTSFPIILLWSTSLYLTLLYSTLALLHSTWLYVTLPWLYFTLLDCTLLYHCSTSLYLHLLYSTMVPLDSTLVFQGYTHCSWLYFNLQWFHVTLLDSKLHYIGSASLYFIPHDSIMVYFTLPYMAQALHSTWFYVSLLWLYFTQLDFTLLWLYFTTLDSTLLYHCSTSLYLTLH